MKFDLIVEPCVPVLDAERKPQILGLRELLVNAHNLKEIQHSSPVVTAALVRFLTALLIDVFARQGITDWSQVWKRKAFDPEAVTAYFSAYADRFDLFHETYPFYQCAALEDDHPINLHLLACERCYGKNNPTLFSHSLDTVEGDYSPVEALHFLLATQSFALAGLLKRTTRLKGEAEPLYWQSAYSGTLIPGAMIWLTGKNLFETLCLNMVLLDAPVDEEDVTQDRPIWRQDCPQDLRDRQIRNELMRISPNGILDHLTFQSRLIRLLPEESNGKIVVRRAAFNHGRSLDAAAQNRFDPMMAYTRDLNKKDADWQVVRVWVEKAVWRDFHTLIGLDRGSMDKHNTASIRQLNMHMAEKVSGLERDRLLRLNVAGLANDKAKIVLWRHDRVEAPVGVLCDPNIAARIGVLLDEAQEVSFALRTASRRLCELFLAPYSVDARGKPVEGAMKADPDRVTALADAADTRPTYWARLESGFHHLLLTLPDDPDAASEAWKDLVEKEARLAFAGVITHLGDSPQTGKAAALVNGYFRVPSRQTKPAGRNNNPKTKEKSV